MQFSATGKVFEKIRLSAIANGLPEGMTVGEFVKLMVAEEVPKTYKVYMLAIPGQKTQTIKLHRMLTGSTLKESKDYADSIEGSLGEYLLHVSFTADALMAILPELTLTVGGEFNRYIDYVRFEPRT